MNQQEYQRLPAEILFQLEIETVIMEDVTTFSFNLYLWR